MRKHIVAALSGRKFNVAWLSLQPDGSISFGLNDRTYISRRFHAHIGFWNAYNRVAIEYVNPSDPGSLEPVVNPHFTFHPAALFHLRANGDDEIFRGHCDVGIVLELDGVMPWIRAVSAPLTSLKYGPPRADAIDTEEWTFNSIGADLSSVIAVDLVKPTALGANESFSTRSIVWRGVGVRVTVSLTWPQMATLSWFHAH
jgi:hypothetical protein